MQTITLSESAVAVLRFRVRGYSMQNRHPEAFRELVDAGIMEPDGEDFRFTEDGWMRRHELLNEAEDRIERERLEPPDTSHLSETALGLLRKIASGEPVEILPENRDCSASWRRPGSSTLCTHSPRAMNRDIGSHIMAGNNDSNAAWFRRRGKPGRVTYGFLGTPRSRTTVLIE